MITGRQIAAARVLLGLTQEELARRAKLAAEALQSIEIGGNDGDEAALTALRSALEDAGISFIDDRATSAAGGVGIRLSVPSTTTVDTDSQETVQYPDMAENGPFGAGG